MAKNYSNHCTIVEVFVKISDGVLLWDTLYTKTTRSEWFTLISFDLDIGLSMQWIYSIHRWPFHYFVNGNLY